MKPRIHNETSFSAKMVVLFALIILAMPSRRKGLESLVKSLIGKDSSQIGQIPVTRIAGQAHFRSSFNR